MTNIALPAWQPIETAPREPVEFHQNDFCSGVRTGPTVLLTIPWGAGVATAGFWVPDQNCWRYLEDDGPKDTPPSRWMPLPEPPEPGQ